MIQFKPTGCNRWAFLFPYVTLLPRSQAPAWNRISSKLRFAACQLTPFRNQTLARSLSHSPLHWRWSSARNYARQRGLVEVVTDWQ